MIQRLSVRCFPHNPPTRLLLEAHPYLYLGFLRSAQSTLKSKRYRHCLIGYMRLNRANLHHLSQGDWFRPQENCPQPRTGVLFTGCFTVAVVPLSIPSPGRPTGVHPRSSGLVKFLVFAGVGVLLADVVVLKGGRQGSSALEVVHGVAWRCVGEPQNPTRSSDFIHL